MTNLTISYFNNVSHTKQGMSLSFTDFLDKVRDGYWQDQILNYRTNKTQENKRALPLVTISGLFKERNNNSLITHSGLIAIDIDGLKNLNDVRELICCDNYFYATFVSCGGSGLCAIAKIDPKLHLESFHFLSKHLYEKYNIIEVDESCKDISRARFVSYDPDLFINKDAIKIKVKPYAKKKEDDSTYVFVESEFSEIVKSIIAEKVDVTANYGDWINIGFALAGKFGEQGRDYFHALSKLNPEYDKVKADQKYTHVLKSKRDPTVPIDFIYNLAKKQNIDIDAVDDKNIINQIKRFVSDKYKMKRNEISRNIEIDGKPITDIDLNTVFIECKTVVPKASKDLVKSVIFSEFTPCYNPFFLFLKDYQIKRPHGNIDKLINSIQTDTANHDLFIKKWLASLMASINGKHSPLVLVLVGGQNTGKTEWFRRLLPNELKAYYAEDKLDQGKDSEILMTKKLIIMDDEMGGKSKAESKTLNRLTSSQTFSIREPYGVVSVDLNRLAMLCGTTNYEGVLSDPTGNRRMLPIRVLSVDFELYNSINKTDLFYEVYHLYDQNPNIYNLTGDEIKLLNESTKEFEAPSQEQDMIMKFFRVPQQFEAFEYYTSTEILSTIKMKAQINLTTIMIGLRMKSLGFTKVSTKINGVPCYAWKVVTLFNLTTNLTTEKDEPIPF
jgi:predicted P-loop ATPase